MTFELQVLNIFRQFPAIAMTFEFQVMTVELHFMTFELQQQAANQVLVRVPGLSSTY
jgi:hypothetical protein